MARVITLFLVALAGCLCGTTSATFNCERATDTSEFPMEVCYVTDCVAAIYTHIKEEFNAAFKYMYMGAYFAQDVVSRPGLANFLLDAASEERGHAIQMLDYLNLRGIKLDNNTLGYAFDADDKLADIAVSEARKVITYEGAIAEALNMEIEVTKLIYNVVEECSDHKDFHGADVFTNPILDEQHDGVRKLQGALNTLRTMQNGHDAEEKKLAEYIFDRKLLSGEI